MTRHETVGEKVHLSFRFEDAEYLNEDEESRKVNDSDQTRKNLMKQNESSDENDSNRWWDSGFLKLDYGSQSPGFWIPQ